MHELVAGGDLVRRDRQSVSNSSTLGRYPQVVEVVPGRKVRGSEVKQALLDQNVQPGILNQGRSRIGHGGSEGCGQAPGSGCSMSPVPIQVPGGRHVLQLAAKGEFVVIVVQKRPFSDTNALMKAATDSMS